MPDATEHVKPLAAAHGETNADVLTSAILAKHGFAHGFSLRTVDPGAQMRSLVFPRVLFQTNQVHGATIARIGESDDVAAMRLRDADALVTSAPVAVGVRVADCVPVLVGAIETGAVAAIHAGWRGVVLGVVPAALAELRSGGDANATLVAAIGPCIGPCCFEVGDDVAEQIAGSVRGVETGRAKVIARRIGKKAFVDLRVAVRAQLVVSGIANENIEDVSGCTKCEPDRFFSFRRDGADAGRHLAVIAARAAGLD